MELIRYGGQSVTAYFKKWNVRDSPSCDVLFEGTLFPADLGGIDNVLRLIRTQFNPHAANNPKPELMGVRIDCVYNFLDYWEVMLRTPIIDVTMVSVQLAARYRPKVLALVTPYNQAADLSPWEACHPIISTVLNLNSEDIAACGGYGHLLRLSLRQKADDLILINTHYADVLIGMAEVLPLLQKYDMACGVDPHAWRANNHGKETTV